MKKMMMTRAALACVVALAVPAAAQDAASGNGMSASPFGTPQPGDPAAVKMPVLAFTPDGTEAADFDKYYAFRRADTDYATAFADISECDGYARGLQTRIGTAPIYYPATVAGAVGSAVGNAMAAAIFGSAEKRRLRRVNMRSCMHFKGYARHGLSKAVWEAFNFEEGLSGVTEERRYAYLQQQALVAASGTLAGEDLGL